MKQAAALLSPQSLPICWRCKFRALQTAAATYRASDSRTFAARSVSPMRATSAVRGQPFSAVEYLPGAETPPTLEFSESCQAPPCPLDETARTQGTEISFS